MTKKQKNALVIIGIILGIAIMVVYAIFPTEFKQYARYIYDLINEPLPVVGVSLVVVAIFTLRLVKFIRQTNPSKELREMREQHNAYVENSEKEKKALKEQNTELRTYMAHICELSTNQKIKNYGKELLGYGEETVDNKPKEE